MAKMTMEVSLNAAIKIVRVSVLDVTSGETMNLDMHVDVTERLIDDLKDAVKILKTATVTVPEKSR